MYLMEHRQLTEEAKRDLSMFTARLKTGELACLEVKSDAVGTSWVYSRFGNNFV
jgi:hypothetical protein